MWALYLEAALDEAGHSRLSVGSEEQVQIIEIIVISQHREKPRSYMLLFWEPRVEELTGYVYIVRLGQLLTCVAILQSQCP